MAAGPIYLVGMMGVGKSTIGPLLADRLGRAFLDSDHEIERRAGRTIPEIFELDGEAHFRRLESEAIEEASDGDVVLALGGGAVAQPGAIERLRKRGVIVYLHAEPELLARRVGSGANRPLLEGLDENERLERLAALAAERAPYYAQAQYRVDASGRADEVIERICRALEEADESAGGSQATR